ncbi:DUF5134 domain-containing protein [Streptomyces sp. NPDC006879]|uniref:DUF5134 domain-containing protein n=1 Tax=Streptomyces sp. NPDC006879 TaxID=3364767 RepID=UPI0036AED8D2
MHATTTSAWLLVALCALSGGSCLLRLREGCRKERVEMSREAVMGLGMAAMAALPAVSEAVAGWAWPWAVLCALFGASSLWALWRRHLHHAVGSLAMVYMTLVMLTAPGGAHAGHGTGAGGVPALTGLLLLYFAGYVLRGGTRLLRSAGPGDLAPVRATVSVTELAGACRLAMGIAMFAMLIGI